MVVAAAATAVVAIDVAATAKNAAPEPLVSAPLEAVARARWAQDADFGKSDR